MSAPGRGKKAKPSPATAPPTPASAGRATTPVKISPQEPTAPAPQPEAPEQSRPVSISSDPTLERDGGAGKGASDEGEVEYHPPELDLVALTRAWRGKYAPTSSDGAIGTGSAAPTYFRKKSYTLLFECERWQLVDDCAEILMRIWEEPHK